MENLTNQRNLCEHGSENVDQSGVVGEIKTRKNGMRIERSDEWQERGR